MSFIAELLRKSDLPLDIKLKILADIAYTFTKDGVCMDLPEADVRLLDPLLPKDGREMLRRIMKHCWAMGMKQGRYTAWKTVSNYLAGEECKLTYPAGPDDNPMLTIDQLLKPHQ